MSEIAFTKKQKKEVIDTFISIYTCSSMEALRERFPNAIENMPTRVPNKSDQAYMIEQ